MPPDPIVFALANPVPEINPVEIAGIAAVIATGNGVGASAHMLQIACGLGGSSPRFVECLQW